MRSLLRYMKGELRESMATSEEALVTAPQHESRVRSLAWYAQGSALRAMGEASRAVEAYHQAAKYGKAAANPVAEIVSSVRLSQMALEQGQLRLAIETAAPVSARVERSGSPSPFRALLHGILTEAHYHRCEIEPGGRRNPARPAFEHSRRLQDRPHWVQGLPLAMLPAPGRILLSRASARAEHFPSSRASVQLQPEGPAAAGAKGFVSLFVEQGLPVAEVLARRFRQNKLGTTGPVYVAGILAAVSRLRRQEARRGDRPLADPRQGQARSDLLEPLTERELEVLRQMAEGLKYQEIAPRLFISVNTVRFHVKGIYGKLGVNNRTQAIHIARQLGLL